MKAKIFIFLMFIIIASRYLLVNYFPQINSSLIFVIELFLFQLLNNKNKFKINKKIFTIFLTLYLIIFFQSSYNFLIPLNINSFINGFIVVPVFLVLIYLLSRIFIHVDFQVIEKVFKIIVFFLILIGWINIIFPAFNFLIGYSHYNHPFFPFSEPSHYSLAVFPFVAAYGINQSNKKRFFLISNLLVQGLLIPNLTLLISILLLVFLFWGLKKIKFTVFFLLLIVTISYFMLLNIPYFSSRFNSFGSESTNLSVLVYIQGWQDMIKSLIDTKGLGLGYRMMGTNEPSEISKSIELLGYDEISRKDGSFLLSRIITEFGVLGMLFVIYIFINLYKFYKLINKKNKDTPNKYLLLFALTVSILIELFVRGGDYFSSTVHLSFSSFIALNFLFKNNFNK